MTIEQLQALLAQYNIKPNQVLGQNFLMDEIIIEDMIDVAGVKSGDSVIEVGPGIGNLTERLLMHGANVLSVEKDTAFLPVLKRLRKEYPNFRGEIGDALTFDYSAVLNQQTVRVVANIPYYITGKLVQLFLHLRPRPTSITLLVQKEVAANIAAAPGRLNLLGLSVQLFGYPKVAMQVPAHKFYPAPKVDSSVVHIDIPPVPPYVVPDERLFFRVVRACFAGKRKQIHNTLENNLGLSKAETALVLKIAGIAPTDRPQNLAIPKWIKLIEEVKDKLEKG